MRALAAGLFAFVTLVGAASAQAWEAGTDGLVPIPPLSAHVTDVTQTLSAPERQALEAKLADWEARTGNQFAVLLVPSTQPEPIEAYAIRVADAWKIGRKGTDNGVLFVVAKNDRKMRLEVGYGFEGILTDATSKRIIAETVAPQVPRGRVRRRHRRRRRPRDQRPGRRQAAARRRKRAGRRRAAAASTPR